VIGRTARRRATVLVTDGEQRAALAVVRSLGRAGHTVYVCSSRSGSLAGASRYARGRFVVPSPLTDPEAFAADVIARCEACSADVLLPVTEAALLPLLDPAHRPANVRLPFPDFDAFRSACDKHYVTTIAKDLGIRVPAQVVLAEPSDAPPLDLRFPVVVKSARSVVDSGRRRMRTGAVHAADAAALAAVVAEMPPAAYPLLVQERITGPGVGAFLLLWNGEVLASFCHRRLREKPPSGGVSVYAESVAPDAELLGAATALLKRLDWRGVAMVEFKRDLQTGEPYLMEVNGRFWGSLQLAVDAGVDFPALLVAAALGEEVTPVRSYRVGTRTRWFLGDCDHLIARLRYSNEQLALPPGTGGRLAAVRDWIAAFHPGVRSEVLRYDDPLPALREAIDWLRRR